MFNNVNSIGGKREVVNQTQMETPDFDVCCSYAGSLQYSSTLFLFFTNYFMDGIVCVLCQFVKILFSLP